MPHARLLLLSLSLLAGSTLSAQQASYTLFGTDCTTGRISPGLGPVPIAVTGLPRPGATFSVVTESTAGYPHGTRRQVVLLTGASNTVTPSGLPLPFDITGLQPGEPIADC